MKETTPEAKQIWRRLATAIADTLECSETPATLADPLGETVNQLAELLAPAGSHVINILLLRGLAQLGDGKTGPGAESFAVANSDARQMRQAHGADRSVHCFSQAKDGCSQRHL